MKRELHWVVFFISGHESNIPENVVAPSVVLLDLIASRDFVFHGSGKAACLCIH